MHRIVLTTARDPFVFVANAIDETLSLALQRATVGPQASMPRTALNPRIRNPRSRPAAAQRRRNDARMQQARVAKTHGPNHRDC